MPPPQDIKPPSVTPSLARDALRPPFSFPRPAVPPPYPPGTQAPLAAAPKPAPLDPVRHVPLLLEYCLEDVPLDGSASMVAAVVGLPLLPLLDGSVSAWQGSGVGGRVFLPSETELELFRSLGRVRVGDFAA